MCGIAGIFHLSTPKPVDPARIEEVGDENADSAASAACREIGARAAYVRFSTVGERDQLIEQPRKRRRSVHRRQRRRDASREAAHGDAVEPFQRNPRESRRHLQRGATLRHAVFGGHESETRRAIDEDVDGEVFFLNEQPREQAIETQPRRAVEGTQVVAGNVGTDVREFDARAFGSRALGREAAARGHRSGTQAERVESREERGRKRVGDGVHESQRSAETEAIASSTATSEVTPSAAAEKRRRTRWRSAGFAQASTSSVDAA